MPGFFFRQGKSSAQRLLKARILLKADVSEAGEGWSDSRIIKALGTSVSMIYGCASNWWKTASRLCEPQATSDDGRRADFRWREGSQTDCLGLFQTSQRRCALDLAVVGEQRRRTRHCRSRQRQHDRADATHGVDGDERALMLVGLGELIDKIGDGGDLVGLLRNAQLRQSQPCMGGVGDERMQG